MAQAQQAGALVMVFQFVPFCTCPMCDRECFVIELSIAARRRVDPALLDYVADLSAVAHMRDGGMNG